MISVGPSMWTPEPPTAGAPDSASSWLRMNCSIGPSPAPPYWDGQCGATQRRSESAACQSPAAARSAGTTDLRSVSQARSGIEPLLAIATYRSGSRSSMSVRTCERKLC